MADTLLDVPRAAALWLEAMQGSYTPVQTIEEEEFTCGDVSDTYPSFLYLGPASNSAGTATLIGIDPDTCISYWHLQGIVVQGTKIPAGAACNLCIQPGPVFQWSIFYQPGAAEDFPVEIFDIGSTTRPIDGAYIIPHTGIPVAAAAMIRADGPVWGAFAAGNAAALTVAAAAAACDTGGLNACGGGGCDTLVRIGFS